MAVVTTISPTTPPANTAATVSVTGLGAQRARIVDDSGNVLCSLCYPDGGAASGSITVGAAGSETIHVEQMISGSWTEVDDLTFTVSSSATGTFSGSTPSALVTMMQRLDLDVIELPAGTYSNWNLYAKNLSRASRPLLVRPASGAAVVWDGAGLGSGAQGPFNFGCLNGPGTPFSVTDYITFDPAGTGGSFTIQNYAIGSFGLVLTGWVDHLAFNGVTVTGCSGVGTQNQSHCLYVNSDNVHHGTNITANGWNVTGDVARTLNGVQTYHNPNVNGLTVHTWTVTKLHRWAYLWGDATGIDLDGWNGTNCDATIDAIIDVPSGSDAFGTVKNSNGHGSCGPLSRGTYGSGGNYWTNAAGGGHITDGGGNSA